MNASQLAQYFDHTLLRADATPADFAAFCADCRRYGFAMAAINSAPVRRVKELLRGSPVHVGAAIGFPLGQTRIDVKLLETRLAIEDGADEIDYVVNLTELKAGNLDYVQREMASIAALCREKGVLSKVIFENCYLTDAEKVKMCEIVTASGAEYIKTSTGFGTGGATREDVALFARHVGPQVKIKAAGGIADLKDAEDFIALGASRLGTSRIVKAVKAMEQ